MLDWYPALKVSETASNVAHGEVYEISDEMLLHMDSVERVDEGLYERKQLRTSNGHLVWLYLYLREVQESQRLESGVFDVTTPPF